MRAGLQNRNIFHCRLDGQIDGLFRDSERRVIIVDWKQCRDIRSKPRPSDRNTTLISLSLTVQLDVATSNLKREAPVTDARGIVEIILP